MFESAEKQISFEQQLEKELPKAKDKSHENEEYDDLDFSALKVKKRKRK